MNELVVNIGVGINDAPLNTLVDNSINTLSNNSQLGMEYNNIINDPMVNTIKDMILNLILNSPHLRNKLDNILSIPDKIVYDINKVLFELRQKISKEEYQKLQHYITGGNVKNNIIYILISSFNNIMSDGKIDINDAPHFIKLITDIVKYFNEISQNNESGNNINSDTLLYFLHFLIKCVLILTLNDQDEINALLMLDNCFNLLSMTVLPITKMKCGCFKRR
jgi:hypothetical protein